jgi:5-methylcytosine-specific restriction endonuclease McrA
MQPQYSAHPNRHKRGRVSPALRAYIIERDGGLCFYCEYEATEADHIVPWSYGGTDDEDNLVACCDICNRIANDKVFDTLEEKRLYLRSRYGPYLEKRWKRLRRKLSICADCQAIYSPQQKGATVVLCRECYERDELGLSGTLCEDRAEYLVAT